MELVKGIKERRSTRKFTDQAVSEDDIREIVATAAYAPSWKNTQTSRYIAVVNPEKKQEIADTCVMGIRRQSADYWRGAGTDRGDNGQ